MLSPPSQLTTVAAEEGKVLSIVGDTYRLVITGKQTEGAYAIIDMLIPPGGGPGPHSHAEFQESFFVLDGEIELKTEAATITASKGAFVNIPRGGMVHAFKNKSKAVAHVICTVVPAGLEAFFEEIGQPVAAGMFLPPPKMDETTMQRLKTLAEKYGQTLFPPDYLK